MEVEEEEEGGAKEGAPEVKGQQGWGQQPVHEASNLRGSGGDFPPLPAAPQSESSTSLLKWATKQGAAGTFFSGGCGGQRADGREGERQGCKERRSQTREMAFVFK